MFCPKCGSEYEDRINEYADCKIPLVYELTSQHKKEEKIVYTNLITVMAPWNADSLAMAKSILEDAKIHYFAKGENAYFHGGHTVEIQVGEEDVEVAKELLGNSLNQVHLKYYLIYIFI